MAHMYYELEMKFPNGNIIRRHYIAVSKQQAINQAERDYPQATKINYLQAWID